MLPMWATNICHGDVLPEDQPQVTSGLALAEMTKHTATLSIARTTGLH